MRLSLITANAATYPTGLGSYKSVVLEELTAW
jgi:hypothetical protein